MNNTVEIDWPEYNHPKNCPIHVRNELDMPAKPEDIWAWIIRVTLWPSWYENSSDINVLKGSSDELCLGTVFRWKTFGFTNTCKLTEFIPNERIAWEANIFGLSVFHGWVLTPSEKGCHGLTEETNSGWIAQILKKLLPKKCTGYIKYGLRALH
jgi:hypothetical protein